jgi:hAT family C-terminal dimerisation region
LSIVARKVFAIPATKAASERIFSKGHSLITDYRSSKSVENINDLLTMCANAAHFEWEITEETTG